jgi:hypothetical protein
LLAALILAWPCASRSFIDPCVSTIQLHATTAPVPLLACPGLDAPPFISQGWWIEVWVLDSNGNGFPNIPAFDFWLIDCDPLNDINLCSGSESANADSATNAQGKTTLSLGGLRAGGCGDGATVVMQGIVPIDSLTNCTTPLCLPVNIRSVDISGDLEVDLVDLSIFAAAFSPLPYDKCSDLNVDGIVDLADLALFALHFGPLSHSCS